VIRITTGSQALDELLGGSLTLNESRIAFRKFDSLAVLYVSL